MRRLRLADLFCCAGGAAVGYDRAGFEVEGVDLTAQPHFPFKFHRGNALRFDLSGFDAAHASPPCKVHTTLRHTAKGGVAAMFEAHEDLIPATRELLIASDLPYVIENVMGAPMIEPVVLCGSSFGLQVRRHRQFETNWPLIGLPCNHASQPVVLGVYGTGGSDSGRAARGGGGGVKVSGKAAADALGIDWTVDQTRLSQAIPPAYTEHIGRQLMAQLTERAA